jgi:twitching motility two-component system response regulator PilG
MRLEIDTAVSAPPLTEEAGISGSIDSTEVKSALNQGIKAAQAGNRAQARTSLLRATELDPGNENAWLWLASISEYPEELLGFLNHVLEINPENQRAKEWKTATHALLSKTFVQRGIDASQENQTDFAAECFQTALEYDDRNAVAWMWMASLSNSTTVKISLLEKALEIEPGNEAAAAALETAKSGVLKERLGEAKSAAVAGNHADAMSILDSLLAVTPDSIEAWTMRSHLAEGFDEKIRCFESILAIDPENIAAKAGRDSLLSIFGTAEATHEEISNTSADAHFDATAVDADSYAEPSIDKSPTQDLEIPAGSSHEAIETSEEKIEPTPEEEYENEEHETIAEPFATYAEEAAEPDETEERVAAYPAIEVELNDLTFGPTPEDISEPAFVYADQQTETVAFSYDTQSETLDPVDHETLEDRQWTAAENSDPAIEMPEEALPAVGTSTEPVGDTVVQPEEVLTVKAESIECPFCHRTNDAQVISCQSCMAVLTLSDLELLLANQNSDKLILRRAVEEMERRRLSEAFNSDQLITLGLGHLNLRNLQMGYSCLAEASRLSPNNVVLGGQVNSLLIRLEEIKKQEEAHLKMPKGKSILVVDDSPTVRKLIAGKLEKCGHEVVCANDGVEAMERLEHIVPDLILLDITMPRMDGYQVCKQIRTNNATKDVTVVMISGKDGFFDKVRGRMAGATGYITKPFGPETLMKAVEMYLSGEAPEMNEV